MQENNLKGLWIPYDILTNEKLSDKEKYIYSLILFFSKNENYCTITNKYIANIVNLSDTRVSKLISSLSRKKYVQVITNFQDTTRQIISRKICTGKKITDPTSGFRAVNKTVIEEFAKQYPTEYPEPESTVSLLVNGYKVQEVPVSMNERTGGVSSIRLFKTIDYMAKVVLAIIIDSISFRRRRKK